MDETFSCKSARLKAFLSLSGSQIQFFACVKDQVYIVYKEKNIYIYTIYIYVYNEKDYLNIQVYTIISWPHVESLV